MRFLKAFLVVAASLIAFDVAGAIVCFIFEVLGVEFMALFYTIWFVAGVFCGLLGYDAAGRQLGKGTEGDWSNALESGRWGLTTIAMTLPLLALLTALFYKLTWEHGGRDGHYAPDSLGLTLTYFIAIIGSMVLGHTVFRPGPSKSK